MPKANLTRPAILKALETGDMTRRDLSDSLELSPATIQPNLRAMLDRKEIHICGWQPPKGKGARAPIYRIGHGRNANWAVQTRDERNAKKRGWAKARAMRNRIAAHAGNPFSSLIAQVSA